MQILQTAYRQKVRYCTITLPYESWVIPSQANRSAELQTQLLSDIGMSSNAANETVSFDLRNVRALQDDQNDLHKRVALDFTSGIIKRNQALVKLGYPEDPKDGDTYAPLGKGGGGPGGDTAIPPGEDAPVKKVWHQVELREWVTINGQRVLIGPDGKAAEHDPNSKAAKAIASHKPSTQEKQDAGDKGQRDVAKGLKADVSPDNQPMDVTTKLDGVSHGVEVKTMLDNGNDKITMHPESRERKEEWAKKNEAINHTVVLDRRDTFNGGANKSQYSGHEIYYRRGVGAYRVGGMYQAKNMAEVKSLMAMPESELPKGAK